MPPANRVHDLLDQLTKRRASAHDRERALDRLDRDDLRDDELAAWYEAYGTAAEERGEIDLAIQRYEEGLARFPRHPSLPTRLRAAQVVNRVDTLLARVQREQDGYNPRAVEAALRGMRRANLRPEEAVRWHQAYAAAAMQRQDRPEAMARYREGVREFPDADVLRFGLGQELEAIGDVDGAFAEFGRAVYPRMTSEFALFIAQLGFLWGRPTEGLASLEPLLRIVFGVGHGEFDQHFLHVRGLPQADRLARFAMALAHQAAPPIRAQMGRRLAALESSFRRVGLDDVVREIEAFAETGVVPFRDDLEPVNAVMRTAIEARARRRTGDEAGAARLIGKLDPEAILLTHAASVVAHGLLDEWTEIRQRYVAARTGGGDRGLMTRLRKLF